MKLLRQKNPLKKTNSDISNVYMEDKHRKLFKSINSFSTKAGSIHGSSHNPVGAATIFKSSIFQKPN